jgi:hypothetical protein
MLLWQEIGDLADVLTPGVAGEVLDDRRLPALSPVVRLWVATVDGERGVGDGVFAAALRCAAWRR